MKMLASGITVLMFMTSACRPRTNEAEFKDAQQADTFVRWAASSKVSINGVEPELDDTDLESIVEFAGKAQILGLGEGAHAKCEFLMLRNRIIAKLIREQRGYSAIVLESGAVEGDIPNAFVKGDRKIRGEEITSEKLLEDGLTNENGNNVENVALLLELKKHNLNRSDKDRVAFYGMDQPGSIGSFEPAVHESVVRIKEMYPLFPTEDLTALVSEVAPPKGGTPQERLLAQHQKFRELTKVNKHWELSYNIAGFIAHTIDSVEEKPNEFRTKLNQVLSYFESDYQIAVLKRFISHPKPLPGQSEIGFIPLSEDSTDAKMKELVSDLRALADMRSDKSKEFTKSDQIKLTAFLDELVTWMEIFRMDFKGDFPEAYDNLKKVQNMDLMKIKRYRGSPSINSGNVDGLKLQLLHSAQVARQTYRQLNVAYWLNPKEPDKGPFHPVAARVREASMAENIEWILKAEEARTKKGTPKLFIFAHTLHLNKDFKWYDHRPAGTYLAALYSNKYKNIHMTGRKFRFGAQEILVPEGYYESVLAKAQNSIGTHFFLNLDSAPTPNDYLENPVSTATDIEQNLRVHFRNREDSNGSAFNGTLNLDEINFNLRIEKPFPDVFRDLYNEESLEQVQHYIKDRRPTHE